ncbi:MAG TPA: tRNA (guanosine(37)-N1)-methyltransferase TrmD [Chthonomonadaceae bacterium]|nr:tRNA (guanosine(37)-N1)-methyltransferase TrmD [Chthonomonadaceae bacterium]
MRIDIVTVFPEMVAAVLDESILKRARDRGLVTINVVNLRDFTTDRHKTTDDMPYGGGGGMVMKIEPIARALEALTGRKLSGEPSWETSSAPSDETAQAGANVIENVIDTEFDREDSVAEGVAHSVLPSRQDAVNVSAPSAATGRPPRILLTDPRGRRFTQELARELAQEEHLILLCGHYEGVDERVRQHLITDEISIGDYILTGGELPALVIVDAVTRLQPGALGDEHATAKDTFSEHLLEYPHYTRPRVFHGWAVPEILLSGHHAQIERWRRWHQLRATQERRPDLFACLQLSPQDQKLLASEEPQAPPSKRPASPPADLPMATPPAAPTQVAAGESAPIESRAEQEETHGTGTGNHT